ncbi:MAG: hypothetical protein HYU48_02790 [Candidatus Levybacteria bacterium]|nr:hypothetical protein [Candidatus Levybacteria bacterium]
MSWLEKFIGQVQGEREQARLAVESEKLLTEQERQRQARISQEAKVAERVKQQQLAEYNQRASSALDAIVITNGVPSLLQDIKARLWKSGTITSEQLLATKIGDPVSQEVKLVVEYKVPAHKELRTSVRYSIEMMVEDRYWINVPKKVRSEWVGIRFNTINESQEYTTELLSSQISGHSHRIPIIRGASINDNIKNALGEESASRLRNNTLPYQVERRARDAVQATRTGWFL